jgi:hypothetical protein
MRMRRVMFWILGAVLFAGVMASLRARPVSASPEVTLSGPSFPVGNLQFTIPAKWRIEMVQSPVRGGQWRVPPLRPDGEGGEVVAFYFGKGIGGSPKENVEAWVGTMFNAEGHPSAYEIKRHEMGSFKISQVVMFGTYNQAVSLPGIPPQPKSNYGLLGAVIENPEGNIYWRFTGPEALITANLPLFNKIVDSVKPQEKAP